MKCESCGEIIKKRMLFCPKCGERIDISNSKKGCGEETRNETVISTEENKVEDIVFCPECGKKNGFDASFCAECGTKFEQDVFWAVKAKKKTRKRKKIKQSLIAFGILAVIILLVCLKVPQNGFRCLWEKSEAPVYYYKDNDIYEIKKGRGNLLYVESTDGGNYPGPWYMSGPQTSIDGRYLFYIKKINECGVGNFCYQTMGAIETEEKIASSVRDFFVLEDDTVLYLTENDSLYHANLKGEKNEIGRGVSEFILSTDEKNLIFTEESSEHDAWDLYTCDLDKINAEKNCLTRNCELLSVSEDNKTVVFEKNNKLYLISDRNEEPVKLATNIVQCEAHIEGDDTVVYYSVKKDARPIFDRGFYNTLDESLKDYLEEYYKIFTMELFRYSSERNEVVELGEYETMCWDELFHTEDNGVLEIEALDSGFEVPKQVLEEIEAGYLSVELYLNDLKNINHYLVVDNTVYPVDGSIYKEEYYSEEDDYYFNKRIDFVRSENDGKIFMEKTSKNETELYACRFSDGELSFQPLKDGIYDWLLYGVDDSYIAFCDLDKHGESSDLYIEGEKIDSGVYPELLKGYGNDDELIFYMKDFKDDSGELFLYNLSTKEKKQIDTNVYMWTGVYALDDNNYVFFKDYYSKKGVGDLTLFKDGNVESIETDVSAIAYDYMARYDKEGAKRIKTLDGYFEADYFE